MKVTEKYVIKGQQTVSEWLKDIYSKSNHELSNIFMLIFFSSRLMLRRTFITELTKQI